MDSMTLSSLLLLLTSSWPWLWPWMTLNSSCQKVPLQHEISQWNCLGLVGSWWHLVDVVGSWLWVAWCWHLVGNGRVVDWCCHLGKTWSTRLLVVGSVLICRWRHSSFSGGRQQTQSQLAGASVARSDTSVCHPFTYLCRCEARLTSEAPSLGGREIGTLLIVLVPCLQQLSDAVTVREHVRETFLGLYFEWRWWRGLSGAVAAVSGGHCWAAGDTTVWGALTTDILWGIWETSADSWWRVWEDGAASWWRVWEASAANWRGFDDSAVSADI